MNSLKRKLKDSHGASMMIALVFMLICLFVGGSVLVAASMNTNRIGREKKDQKTQRYLNQRSAAMLISDKLQQHGSDDMRLIIRDQTVTAKDEKTNLKVSHPKAGRYIKCDIIYPEGKEMSGMERLVYETAIVSYLEKIGENAAVTCNDFRYGPVGKPNLIANNSQFLVKYVAPQRDEHNNLPSAVNIGHKGNITLTFGGSLADVMTVPVNTNFRCDTGKENVYDFVVDFEGEHLEVRMDASVDDPANAVTPKEFPVVEEVEYDPADPDKATVLTTTLKMVTISWSAPRIQVKKGA